jgi:hypothetical protein
MQKAWVLDPNEKLQIYTETLPPILRPFKGVIIANLQQLMDDCGFSATVKFVPSNGGDFYAVSIRFPQRITDSSSFSKVPATLCIEDEISKSDVKDRLAMILAGEKVAEPEAPSSYQGPKRRIKRWWKR